MDLIERYLDDALSPEEAARLLDLLRDDAEVRAEFVRQARLHGLLSAAIGPDAKLGDVVMLALPTGPRALDSKVMEGIRRRSRRPLWIAAAVGAVAALAFAAFRPAALRGTVTLEDGTRLELGADAEVESAGYERVVLRRGSLLARVKPRTSRPLVFATPHAEARVLGTTLRLTVDGGTRLDVEEGRVELKNRAGKAAIVEAGQTASATYVDLVPPGWTNVTGALGGEAWGFSGVTWIAPVPGKDEVLAGVSEAWLWSSADGGATWRKLGGAFKNRPFEIHFGGAGTFWASGIYGPGLLKTSDGGASFEALGLDHVEGFGVAGTTLVAATHRGEGNLHRSRDGGRTWERLTTPEDRATAMDPLVLDATTYLISAEGRKQPGLFRSVDAGATWTLVAPYATAGPALVASDGAIYWGRRGGLLKSADRGATWTEIRGPVKSTPIELPGGALVGAAERQLFRSLDGGARWDKLGPPLPIVPSRVVRGTGHPAVAYLHARRAFFIWRSTDAKVPDAVFRWIEAP